MRQTCKISVSARCPRWKIKVKSVGISCNLSPVSSGYRRLDRCPKCKINSTSVSLLPCVCVCVRAQTWQNRGFAKDMWLEAVNPHRPAEVCVAQITQVRGRLLWLRLEGTNMCVCVWRIKCRRIKCQDSCCVLD